MSGQFVEQLILVDGVGLIGQQKHMLHIALYAQRIDTDGVGGHTGSTPRPDISDIKLAAIELPSLTDTSDNHARQFAYLTLRIIIHHLFHVFCTSCCITLVEQAQTLDEEEFRTMLPQGKTTF